jgi:hypothetical protein
VAEPWVPKYLSFLDFQKPIHRVGLMIAFAAFSLIGLLLAGFFYSKEKEHAHFNAVAQKAEGELTGTPKRHDKRRRRYSVEAYDIKYKFKVNDQWYQGIEEQVEPDDMPDGADPYHSFDSQGVKVLVFYDPDDPKENRLHEASTGGDWFMVAIGAVIVPVGLYGGWRVFRYDRYARSVGA